MRRNYLLKTVLMKNFFHSEKVFTPHITSSAATLQFFLYFGKCVCRRETVIVHKIGNLRCILCCWKKNSFGSLQNLWKLHLILWKKPTLRWNYFLFTFNWIRHSESGNLKFQKWCGFKKTGKERNIHRVMIVLPPPTKELRVKGLEKDV